MNAKTTVNGIDRTTYVERDGIDIDEVGNGRWTATIVWRTGYTPVDGGTVIIYEADEVTPHFAGIIWTTDLIPIGPHTYQYRTPCVDFNVYADRRQVYLTYTTSVTLLQVLTDLLPYLTSFGVTLDPAQVTGPTLEPFPWDGKKLSDCLNELNTKTGYLWRINFSLVLAMTLPGSLPAPISLVEGGTNWRTLSWTRTKSGYANRITLRCGPPGTTVLTPQSWTCNGSDTSWQTDLPALLTAGVVWVDDGVVPFNATVGTGADFEWDPATHTLSVGTYGTPAAGVILTLRHYVLYPFYVTAEDLPDIAAQGLYEAPIQDEPTITLKATGQEKADGLLRQAMRTSKVATIETYTDGLSVGQSLVIDLETSRAISGTFLITQIRTKPHALKRWEYTVTAVEGAEYLKSALQMGSGVQVGGGSGILSLGGTNTVYRPAPVPLGGSRFHTA